MSTAHQGAPGAYAGDVWVDVRVDVVGVPTVTGPDGVVAGSRLGGRRAQAVLAALALEGGTQSGAHLAALVWDGRPPATWPVALRGVIGGLRSVLRTVGIEDQALVATVPGGYRLAPGVTVDVTEARDLLDRAQELIRAGRPRAARELLAPLAPWRGADVLPDDEAEWLHVQRERVDGLVRRARELTVESAVAAGDRHQALAAAEQWVAAAPLDERAHRALVAALDAAGDRAGAVRAYEACRTLLAHELGVDPTRETVEVYLHALGDESALAAAPVPRASTSFVGRAEEVVEVSAHLTDPGLVTVAGPAGVGKSRIVAEVVHGLRGQGRPVRWVPLESVTQDALVPATVALALESSRRRPGRIGGGRAGAVRSACPGPRRVRGRPRRRGDPGPRARQPVPGAHPGRHQPGAARAAGRGGGAGGAVVGARAGG